MNGAPRVVVFGYDELVHATLQVVRESGGDVAAVVFPSVRRSDVRVARVRADVESSGVRVIEQPPRAGIAPFARQLSDLGPDLALVWSYPMLLPQALLEVPRLGCLNVHIGLLPEYRGASALQWAIANGETETGVTLHYMDEGLDTGPLLARARIPIGPDDTVVDVLRRARTAGVRILCEGWPHFSRRRLPARAQDESRARTWPRRTVADDRIDWSAGSGRIRDLVRATAAPFPGAHAAWRGAPLVVRGAELDAAPHAGPPGTVVGIDAAGVRVATGDGSLIITRMERAGRAISPAEFAAAGAGAGQRFG